MTQNWTFLNSFLSAIHPSNFQSVYLYIYVSLSIYLSIYLPTYLSIYASTYLLVFYHLCTYIPTISISIVFFSLPVTAS
jgi:hypothetical protein